MAGIGFELKKMFKKKGILSLLKAYGYAGVIVTGPMILGILLLLGIRTIATFFGASESDVELLNSMVTVSLLSSMFVSNIYAMVTTRYVSDQLFEEQMDKVLPSFFGSITIMLVIGGLAYGIFLAFAGIPATYAVLNFIFFAELIIVWTEMNYLTAIKDYKGIMLSFLVSIIISFAASFLLNRFVDDVIICMLITVSIAYGILAVWYYLLLAKYFPVGNCSSLYFMKWFDKYPQLMWIGIFSSLGMYGHILIMWTSPIQKHIRGLYYAAPIYDVSALLAFFSVLITTINFVTSVEVNFYPKYRNFFGLFNGGGTFTDIEQAEKEMKTTLTQELSYTFTKQFFATIVFIIAGTLLLPRLPLGMTEDMLGIYRVLCVGYALYAIGNCTMLIQLYFADNKGALISTGLFMLSANGFTFLTRNMDIKIYGAGFIAGALIYSLVALFLLRKYLRKIIFNVLCNQPIVVEERRTFNTRISYRFERKYRLKYRLSDYDDEGDE